MVSMRKNLVKSGFTGGSGNKKKYLTIHQTDNWSVGADADAHARAQVNAGKNARASWHWTVDDKEAVQSFPHETICWHAGDGNGEGNKASIAIESCVNKGINLDRAFENTAQLAAYILKSEGIPISRMVQHNHWSGKNCPSGIRGKGQWPAFVARVKALMGGAVATAPVKPGSSKPSTSKPSVLVVDGIGGSATVSRLQSVLGGIVDGFLSGQYAANKKFFVGLTAVRFGSGGSRAVILLQKMLGVTADGVLGPQTVRAWQKKLGVIVDGFFGKASVIALQKALNRGQIW